MKYPVVTVTPRDSVRHARGLLEKHRINQLPVVTDGRLVGIVTDRDLRDVFPSVFEVATPSRRAESTPSTDPATIPSRADSCAPRGGTPTDSSPTRSG